MVVSLLSGHGAEVYPSLPGHVVEGGYRGAAVGLAQAFLPLTLAVLAAVLRAVGTEHVVQVVAAAAQAVSQAEAQLQVVLIRLGNIGLTGYQLADHGRGQSQFLRRGVRLAGRRLRSRRRCGRCRCGRRRCTAVGSVLCRPCYPGQGVEPCVLICFHNCHCHLSSTADSRRPQGHSRGNRLSTRCVPKDRPAWG